MILKIKNKNYKLIKNYNFNNKMNIKIFIFNQKVI